MLDVNPTGKHAPKRRRHGEGTAYKRTDKPRLRPWCCSLRWTDSQGKRHRLPTHYEPTRKAAEAWLKDENARIAQALDAGGSLGSMGTTVGSYMGAWINRQRDQLRPGSWETYEIAVRLRIIPTLGSIPLRALSVDDVRDARAAWGQNAKSAFALRILSGALTDALADGLVSRNVARLVERPRTESREAPAIGPDDLRATFAAVRGDWLYPIVVLAGLCGLRRGEILGLRRGDIDLVAGTLTVEGQVRHIPLSHRAPGESPYQRVAPKTATSRRTIGLPALAAEALREHFERIESSGRPMPLDGLIFTAGGQPLNPNRATKRFSVLMTKAGTSGVRLHDQRHAAATTLAAQGVHPRVAMAIMGHSTETMTHAYTSVLPDTMRDAAERVDRAIAEG